MRFFPVGTIHYTWETSTLVNYGEKWTMCQILLSAAGLPVVYLLPLLLPTPMLLLNGKVCKAARAEQREVVVVVSQSP